MLVRQSFLLTHSLLKARYRRTLAGFAWVTLNPIIRFAAQIVVFHYILRVPTENYALYLVTGLLPWHFFSQSLEMCTPQLIDYSRWIRSLPAHPSVYIIAQVFDCLVGFSAAFFLLFFLTATNADVVEGLVLLPLALLPLLVFTISWCWIFSVLQVFFRDTRFILSLGLQVGFFITPIFYPAHLVPAELSWLVTLNPVHHFLEPFRHALFQPDMAKFKTSMLIASGLALVSAAIAIRYGESKRDEIVRSL